MNKPLSNITFILISIIIIIQLSIITYLKYQEVEILKEKKDIVIKQQILENNETGFFSTMYIKTKNLFK